jgi:hypothetical protein
MKRQLEYLDALPGKWSGSCGRPLPGIMVIPASQQFPVNEAGLITKDLSLVGERRMSSSPG